MTLDQRLGTVATRPVDHLMHDVAQRHQLFGGQPRERLRHVLLPFQEQALQAEGPHPHRVEGAEDHVQRQPVGGDADNKAEQRQHPVAGHEDEDRYLDQTEQKTEVEAGIGDEAEFRLAHFLKQLHHERLVRAHALDNHVLHVHQVFQVVADIVDHVIHHRGNRPAGAGVDPPAHGQGQVLPEHRVALGHHLVDVFLDTALDALGQVGGDLFRFHLTEKLVQAAQLLEGFVHHDGGHLLHLGGNNALPAEERPDTQELQGIEGHLHGHPVGGPTHHAGYERDTEVFPEIRMGKNRIQHVGRDSPPREKARLAV